ncbi:MAG: spermidine/putrescine ABC transporter substrate-binding protein [Anaerolineae bacterium]|nr:spermidine/putrescine ABC transporter substrate-binding protein [Anaerolineae bacterium]
MRKVHLLTLLVLCLFALPLAAQDEAAEPTADDITWTCPEGFQGETLNVYNWTTYIGETTISDFEALCGVTVNYDNFDTNEQMVARLRQGNPGYDIVFANEYIIPVMIRQGLVQEIDLANIPNIANIAERWRGLDFDPDNQYTVPYLWGTTGVAYNVDKVGEITSWDDVFNYDGPVAWIADIRTMFPIALRMLGYDPNTTNPDEINAARDYLLERSDNVVAFAEDDGQVMLERGEVDIAIEYSGDVFQLRIDCACDTFSYAIPEEGSIADIANMLVPADAPHPELAQAFMDYILDPAVNAMIVNYTAYATPDQAAIDSGFIPSEFLDNPTITPDAEAMQNLWFLKDIGDAEVYYSDAWDELRILSGR